MRLSPLLDLSLDVAAGVCAALLAVRVAISAPRRPEAWLVVLLCASAIAHVTLGRADYAYWIAPAYRIEVGDWRPVLNLIRNLAPGLFMLLAHALFADQKRPPLWLTGLFLLQVLLEEAPGGRLLTEVAPAMLQALFAGAALYWIVAYWRADLVEARRRARAVAATIITLNVVASSILLRVVIPADSRANFQAHLWLNGLNLLVIGGTLIQLMGRDLATWFGPAPRPAPPAAARAADDARALARLQALFEADHIHREAGLTLGALAVRAGLPEHRLRRLIHEALGHRNFNAFLHARRIEEAARRLADPAERRTPITTIALEVGYRSLNTFNRGFREVTGETPSAWRARMLDDPASLNLAPETA